MDFFQYASAVSKFGGGLLMSLLIGALCFAIVFIFEGVALFIIAKREGYKNRWMAFVPFFNTYYIGVCAQKNKFYNIDAKKIGLAVAIFELVLVIGYILLFVSSYLVNDYVYVVTETDKWGLTYESYQLSPDLPANLNWAAWIFTYLDLILSVAELVYLLLEVFLFLCFFQTYACRRYLLFTLTSIIFPIQGILFFIVRNNRGVNYREFVKREREKMYQQYQQQQNFYQNPYNQNPYNRNYNDGYGNGTQSDNPNNQTGRSSPPEDPFGDLGGSDGSGNSGASPFDDYN